MSSKITCWNTTCYRKCEILYSKRIGELRCVTCADGSSYEHISCKSCSKKHLDEFGNLNEFYFEPIRSPTSMEFYCSDCAEVFRSKQEKFVPLGINCIVFTRKCQSSLHQKKDDDRHVFPSTIDKKNRCVNCENQFLKIELENQFLKIEFEKRKKELAALEKRKVKCQSSNHKKSDDDKSVAPSKNDGKNRCVNCELIYTQNLLEFEKLKH